MRAKKMRSSSLAYGIVCIKNRVTCITNEVLTSKHDSVFDMFACELHLPQKLTECNLFAQSCSKHPYVTIMPVAPCIVLKNLIVCLNNPSAYVNCV